MKKILLFVFLLPYICFSQEKTINSLQIAKKHYNSIVKILLIDSIAEKKKWGSGYIGRGSGFFVNEDGLIFTNKHVAEYALGFTNYTYYDRELGESVTKNGLYHPNDFNLDLKAINYISKATMIVQVYDKPDQAFYRLYEAKLVSIDTANFDGAIIKITSTIDGRPTKDKFNPVKIGNSDSTSQGEDLCVYGFPQQYSGGYETMLSDQSTMLAGKHAGFDNVVNRDYGFIKTDIPISAGNSGGPVFNSSGLVIGIATAASSKTGNGFISKINGMYNLSKNNFALENSLKLIRIRHTYKRANTNGVVNAETTVLPNEQRIAKYNKR